MRRHTPILLFCACYITISSADLFTSNRLLEDRALYRDLMRSFTCESEGFHPDVNDCTTFYRCIDWGKSDENSVQSRFTSFQFQCGPGTVFEPETSICVHPASSSREECRQYTLPENPEPEPMPPDYDNWGNQPESQPPQPAYPSQPSGSPSNTDYLGSGRPPKPVYMQPESPSQGNPGYGEAPQQPDNSDNSVDSMPEPPPAQNPNLPKCVAEGFFAIENDCAHFYRCVAKQESEGFIQYQFTCGAGTIFDPDNNVCNYAGAVGRGDCKSEDGGAPSPDNAPDPSSQSGSGPSSGYNTPAPQNSPSPPDQGPPPSENNEEKPIEFPGATQPPSTPATRPSATYPTRPTGAAGGSQPGYGPQSKPTSTTTSPRPTTTSRPTYPKPSNTGGSGSGYGPQSVTREPTSSRRPPASASQTKPVKCSSEGFFPIEGDCKKFIRCVDKGNGTFAAYGFDCGEGTVWDTEQNTCNFPESVQRPDCGLTTPRPPPTKAPSNATSTKPSSPSTYPAQTKPVTQGGSYYTTPSVAPTTSKQTTTKSTTTTSKPTTTYKTTAKPYTTTKPPYTSPSTTSSTSRPSYPTRPSDSNSGGNSGYGPPSTTTTTTSTSRPTYPTRPSDTNGGGDSGYGAPSTTTTSTSKPSTTPSNSSCSSEGYFPVPDDCSKFIRCVSNGDKFTKYEFDCGPGTVWDPENNVCNHPSAVPNCGQLPDQTTSSTQGPSSTEKKPPYTTTKSTPYDYTTSKSSTTTKPTSYTTTKPAYTTKSTTTTKPAYTTKSTTTTTPAYTTKSTTTTTTTTKYPTKTTTTTTTTSKPYTTKPSSTTKPTNDSTTPIPCEEMTKAPSKIKCEKAGFFPHPDDCKKFYRCVDWDGDKGERFSVFHFDCPEGTIFDPALDTCNYEASVYPPRDCSGSNNTTAKPCQETPKPCSQTTASPATASTNSYTTEPTTYKPESTTGAYSTSEYSTESSTYSSTEPSTYGSTESSTYSSTEPSTYGSTESSTYSSTEPSTYGSTESSTYSSTEPSTYGSTESSTYGSTESSTYSSTETESSTYSSTPHYTTESSTYSSTEPTTDYYSTERTTETATETTTHTPGQVNQTCPDLEENQFAIACPTGFRRHPKYCNMFYQCTLSESAEIKVLSFSCPDNTVFDDSKLQCLSSEQTTPCSGDYAQSATMTLDVRSSPGELEDGSLPPVPVTSKKPLCPTEGNFPYENDCRMLYKCKKDGSGKISGYLYQCPEGYSYWDVSKRCEKNSKTPSCQRGNGIVRKDWKPTIAPLETGNIGY